MESNFVNVPPVFAGAKATGEVPAAWLNGLS